MLNPRLTNCTECVDTLSVICDIDYNIGLISNCMYNSLVFALKGKCNAATLSDLLNYRRILVNKYYNPAYVSKFSLETIVGRVRILTGGVRNPEVFAFPDVVTPTTTTTTTLIPSLYVAGSYGDNSLGYSYDGITWTGLGNTIFTSVCTRIIYNGTMWVACGSGTNSIAYSYNGIDWVGLGSSLFTETRDLVWNGTMWVIVGNGVDTGYSIAYSYNGIDWTITTFLGKPIYYTVAWDGTQFIVGGQSSVNDLVVSTDGINWTNHSSGIIGTHLSIRKNSSIWVDAGYPYLSENTNRLAYSYDGLNWTGVGNTIFSGTGEMVAHNNTRWVAVGQGGCTVAYSNDGISWTQVLLDVMDIYGGSILWDKEKFIAAGTGMTVNIAMSSDGITWTGYHTDVFIEILGMACNRI